MIFLVLEFVDDVKEIVIDSNFIIRRVTQSL